MPIPSKSIGYIANDDELSPDEDHTEPRFEPDMVNLDSSEDEPVIPKRFQAVLRLKRLDEVLEPIPPLTKPRTKYGYN